MSSHRKTAKTTATEFVKTALEAAGFTMRPSRKSQYMVVLVRAADGKCLGLVHRFSIPRWLRGERVDDWRGNKLPPVAEALTA